VRKVLRHHWTHETRNIKSENRARFPCQSRSDLVAIGTNNQDDNASIPILKKNSPWQQGIQNERATKPRQKHWPAHQSRGHQSRHIYNPADLLDLSVCHAPEMTMYHVRSDCRVRTWGAGCHNLRTAMPQTIAVPLSHVNVSISTSSYELQANTPFFSYYIETPWI